MFSRTLYFEPRTFCPGPPGCLNLGGSLLLPRARERLAKSNTGTPLRERKNRRPLRPFCMRIWLNSATPRNSWNAALTPHREKSEERWPQRPYSPRWGWGSNRKRARYTELLFEIGWCSPQGELARGRPRQLSKQPRVGCGHCRQQAEQKRPSGRKEKVVPHFGQTTPNRR